MSDGLAATGMRKPKIAVYSIALNEEKHVKQWFDSSKEADMVLLADTGSTDRTVELAKELGITVHEISVNPWRFDVARNESLALIPADYDICIQLDLDEVLQAGWRPIVEAAWHEGNVWPLYKHVTQRFADGRVRKFQNYFKIHPRHGFIWKYPIHEVLQPDNGVQYDRRPIELEVDHLQDPTKSRKSYLGLLEQAVKDEPKDWRMNHYLVREYYYHQAWLPLLQTAYKAIEIKGGWDVERASTCVWASEAAMHLELTPVVKDWARKATEQAPLFYEAWYWRANVAHLRGEWDECLLFASKILYLQRGQNHLVRPDVWEWRGFDLIALASYKLGKAEDAVKYGRMALENAPEVERLASNLKYYEQQLAEQSQG